MKDLLMSAVLVSLSFALMTTILALRSTRERIDLLEVRIEYRQLHSLQMIADTSQKRWRELCYKISMDRSIDPREACDNDIR